METIKQDDFHNYSFLSNLQLSKDGKKYFFVETKSDIQNNAYKQRLHVYDSTKNIEVFTTPFEKSFSYFLLDNDQVLVIRNSEGEEDIRTEFFELDLVSGKEEPAFNLPLNVSDIKDFNDDFYLVKATINQACPDYHELSEEDKKAYLKKRKEDEDYLIFDEYPFFFNGEGIINGNRTTLFLIDKKTKKIKNIVKNTIDVESYDIDDGKLVYSGVDYTTFKGKWSHVWQYDILSDETETKFNEVMQIYKVFFMKGEVVVLGTFALEYGAMEAGKFYWLKDGKMELMCDNEYSMHNSLGSDCRYGKTKNFFKNDGVPYFITSSDEQSIIVKLTQDGLSTVVDFKGSCDDLLVDGKKIYLIGMKDQKLQEIYEFDNNELKQITSLNEEVLKDKYVAVPERVVVKKENEIIGWVLKPYSYDPNKKYPAIMDIHGGPKTNYGTVFYHEMQYWANLGYFVFFCNPRGSDGKGNAFADLRKNFGKIDYEDLMDFVDEVLKIYPSIDAKRLGVTGGSYGGYMTNWIIGHTDRFKCAASQRSISNWITEVCASDYGIDFPIEQEFEDLYNCQEELWDMSPLKYANNVSTPTLFIQSTEDYRCPIPEAIQMYTVLKCRGIESRLVGFKGENHELSRSGKPLHRSRRLYEITSWMETHLK